MRLIDADALKEKFKERSYWTYTHEYGDAIPIGWIMSGIDNAPSFEPEKAKESEIIKAYTKGFDTGVETVKNARPQGEWLRKEDVIHSITKQYSEHNELVPIWLSIGDMKGGAE